MKEGLWNKKRALLKERDELLRTRPPAFAEKLKLINEAINAEEERHRIAVLNFKNSRKTWK